MAGLLDIIMGYDCNVFCDYCTISPEMRQRSLSAAAIERELRAGRDHDYDRVSFTGGEPTIRGDLLPLVRRSAELGYEDIKVQTNGLLLASPENLARLLSAGVTRLHQSIHTHREDRYDRLVRRDGAYPLMVAALERMAQTDAAFIVDVILKRDTYRDLVDCIDWLAERGVREVHLWFVSLTDHNADNVDSMPRMTEVVPIMHDAFRRGDAHEMTLRSLHVPRCLLGPDYAARAYDPGMERVRVVTPEATFELRDSKLTGSRFVPACDGCEHRQVCPGIREDYVRHYGDAEFARARGMDPTVPPRLITTK